MNDRPRNPDNIDDLWRFYDEHAAQARQNETLRASVTAILSGFAGALAGLAGNDGLGLSDLPVSLVVVILGFIGFLLSLGHYGKNRFHVRIMGSIRDDIEANGGFPTDEVRERGVAKFKKGERKIVQLTERWRWWLWAVLPLLVSSVGVLLVVLSIVGVSPPT